MKVTLDSINANINYTRFNSRANIRKIEGAHSPVYSNDKHIIPNLCQVDAPKSFNIHYTFDVVLSKEVSEHILKKGEAKFIDNLLRLAKPCEGRIILTWVQPGQGGKGYVNCQSKSHIIEKIKK